MIPALGLLLSLGARAEAPLTPAEGLPYVLQTATLDNGLQVWIQPRPDATSVVAYLSFRAGSRYEDETTSGASHLLEHMLFVQTDRWAEAEIRAVIDRAGGVFNGQTHQERVTYWARLPAGQTDTLLDWLDQVAFHPSLPADKLDKEREVVFEERSGRDGWTVRTLKRLGLGVGKEEAARQELWPGSTRALRVIGEDASLESIDIDRLRRFYQDHYTADNAALVVVGPDDPAAVLALVSAKMGDAPAGQALRPPDDLGPDPILGGRRVLRQLFIDDQCTVAQVARGPAANDRLVWAASVAMQHLEIGLNDDLRLRRGLTYGVSGWTSAQSDSGELWLTADVDCENTDVAASAFEAAVDGLRRGEVNADWLTRARGAVLGSWAISQEDSYTRAFWLGSRFVLDAPFQEADFRSAVPAVTEAQVVELARRWLAADRTRIYVVRPILTIDEAWALAGVALGFFFLFLGLWRRRRRRRMLMP